MVLFSLLMVLICLNTCSGAKISDNVTVYVTTNDRAKDFVRSEIALGDKQAASPCVITIDPSVRYQTMDGFGAAVTYHHAGTVQPGTDGSVTQNTQQEQAVHSQSESNPRSSASVQNRGGTVSPGAAGESSSIELRCA